MSTEKLQSLLADILSEPPLISTHIKPSPPTFFDEEPDEAAQEPGEVGINADQNALLDPKKASAPDIRLTHEEIHEAPKIGADGIVGQTFAEQTPADAPADAENLA